MHHMTTPHLSPLSFTEVCACMRFGQVERVHDLLHTSTALPWHPREKAYLAAWVFCCEEEWETAATILLAENSAGRDAYLTRTEGATIRRKKPWVLWLLGKLAHELACVETGEHYSWALHFLDERRMNIPWLRVQLHTDHARWLSHINDGCGAKKQYDLALALCVVGSPTHEVLPEIYAGLLAQTSAGHEKQALEYGALALASVTTLQTQAEILSQMARVYERLGQDGEAMAAYQKALQLTEDETLLIAIRTALALLSLKAQDLLGAQGYCALALDKESEGVPPETLGHLYLACGRVAHRQQKEEMAVTWATRAIEITPKNAEALGFLAQILEELLERTPQVALTAFWREGYRVVTSHLS